MGKIVSIILSIVVIVFGIWWMCQPYEVSNTKSVFNRLFGGGDEVVTVGTNTYAGFLPLMYLNDGVMPNEESIIYKEYGIKLKIVIQDDFEAGRSAFQNGIIDIMYCTADALPVEMSEDSKMPDARFFNISNWSRGADAIVVNEDIQTVSDLIGKVVACSEGTASHTLLLNTLETNGIGYDKINTGPTIENDKVNIKFAASGIDAAAIFIDRMCDAAVVFSPDDQNIVATVEGSKILVTTKEDSTIICDGLIAKQSYLESNKETVKKLISAILSANVKMNTDSIAVSQAAKAFAKSYGTDEQFAIDGSKNIHYVTLGDEANFFGLNPSYAGMKGSELYTKMARIYSELNLCESPLPWNKVSDASIIKELMADPSKIKGEQSAEK